MKDGWVSRRCKICWKLISSGFFPTLGSSVVRFEDTCKDCRLREAKEGTYMATTKNKNVMKAKSMKVVKKKPAAKASDLTLKRL